MFYRLCRIFVFWGCCANAGALLLRQVVPEPLFAVGFLEGAAIAGFLGALYFLRRAREAGEPKADTRICRWKKRLLHCLLGKGEPNL